MPGIFAPEISVDQGGGDRPRVASSSLVGVGSALGGLGDLFASLPSETEGGESSREEVSRVLRPLTRQLNNIKQAGGPQQKTRFNTAITNFIVNNPGYEEDAFAAAERVTGISLEPDPDPAQLAREGLKDWVQNDPRGQFAALASQVVDDNGVIDPRATQLNLTSLYQNHLATQSRIANLQDEQTVSTAQSTIARNNAQLFLSAYTAEKTIEVTKATSNLVRTALTNLDPTNPLDSATAKRELVGLKASLSTMIQTEAAALGYEGNGVDFDIEIAMTPINNLIAMIDTDFEAFQQAAQAMTTRDQIKLSKIMEEALGIPGIANNKAAMEIFAAEVARNNLSGFGQLAKAMQEDQTLWNGIDSPFNSSVIPSAAPTVDPETGETVGETTITKPYNGEAKDRVSSIPPADRLKAAENGFTIFKSVTDPALLARPGTREMAIKGIGNALVALDSMPTVLDERAFDKIFDDKFFQIYNTLDQYDEASVVNMRNAVGDYFAETLNKRLEIINRNLTENLKFSAITVDFNSSGQVELVIAPWIKTSSAPGDVKVRQVLQDNNLPLTKDGFNQLLELQRRAVGGIGLPYFRDLAELRGIAEDTGRDSLTAQIRKFNKVLSAARKLGPIGIAAEDSIKDVFKSKRVVVTSEEEFKALPDGTAYTFLNPETGERIADGVK